MDEHSHGLVLVGVKFAEGAFFDVEAQEAAEVAGAEPGLVFEEEGVEVEFVAGEPEQKEPGRPEGLPRTTAMTCVDGRHAP